MRWTLCIALSATACAEGSPQTDETPVAGITLASVEANQGVPIDIGLDGEEVDWPDRNGPVLSDRPTLVRANWALDDDWEPRSLLARLRLEYADGDEVFFDSERVVGVDSDPETLDGSFAWELPAQDLVPDMRYRIELFDEEGEALQSVPEEGTAMIGVEPTPQHFEVTLVPIERDAADCTALPDVRQERVDGLRERLSMQLPVQTLDLSVREPVVWTEPLESLDPIIDFLGELREQDGAATQVHYYALLGSCGKINGAIGQAHSIPAIPVPSQPWTRVGVGLSLEDFDETAHTMMHELGHALGRRHIACTGTENEPDESYPYRDGSIGRAGWGILDGELRSPAAYADYMGYCFQDWVSDFGWAHTFLFIREMTAWSGDDGEQRELLVGSVDLDGTTRLRRTQGSVSGAASARVEWFAGSSPVGIAAAEISRRPDSDALNLVTPWLSDAATHLRVVPDTGPARVLKLPPALRSSHN